jgi:N-methylhydantoinase A/oxoprolinase/acetone carboxylase beta subunit
LTGAIFLADLAHSESGVDLKTSQVIMVDIGGTTSDFAALSPTGFPRQALAAAKIAGVRTAFSMPEVLSIGLGGGSYVTTNEAGDVAVGPTSVGHRLHTSALCFGGQTTTATDIAVAKGYCDESLPPWSSNLASDVISKASRQITLQLQRSIDAMKTSDLDVVLLLVGGGSIIQAEELSKVKKCIQPHFYKVANAVGAAIAKV